MQPPQFSLRTLFTLTGLCAVLLAVGVALGHEIVLRFSGFALSCGFVVLVAFALTPLARTANKIPYPVALILIPAIYGVPELAFFLFGEAIEQPHPIYLHGKWVTVALSRFLPVLSFMAIAILSLVAVDAACQTSRPRDIAYFPRVANLRAVLTRFEIRLPFIIGVMLVLAYYAATVDDVWYLELRRKNVRPPERVFLVCNLLWGVLWLADCLTRPKRGTIVAAVGFLVLTFFFLLAMGFPYRRE